MNGERLPALLHRIGKALRQACGRPGPDDRRPQRVVLLLLSVHGVPPLFRLLPLRDRSGGNHHDGPGAPQPRRLQHQLGHGTGGELLPYGKPPRHPARRRQGHARIHGRRHRGPHRRAGRSPSQQERGRYPLCHAFGRLLRRPGDVYVHGIHDALPRDRPELHLQHLRLRGGELRPVHLPRNDQAPQRQDLRGGEAPRGEVDPRGRVRPYVAGAPPVHGHDEGPRRLSRRAGFADHRDAF